MLRAGTTVVLRIAAVDQAVSCLPLWITVVEAGMGLTFRRICGECRCGSFMEGFEVMKGRLILGFTKLNEAAFHALASAVVTSMKQNPNFPEPWWPPPQEGPTWATVNDRFGTYEQAMYSAMNGDRNEIARRKRLRGELAADLVRVGNHVEAVAQGDIVKLQTSGYQLAREREAFRVGVVSEPMDVRLFRGHLIGMLIVRSRAVRGARSYEVQYCVSGEVEAGAWKPGPVTTGCRRIELRDLTPGVIYVVRMRAIGSKGPGKWSDTASLRVV